MDSGEMRIWYSLMSPPMTDTWDTPPIASRRGRIVRSAMVRRSLIEVESAVRPIIIISPRIDDCGPIVGVLTPVGRRSATSGRRSDTI